MPNLNVGLVLVFVASDAFGLSAVLPPSESCDVDSDCNTFYEASTISPKPANHCYNRLVYVDMTNACKEGVCTNYTFTDGWGGREYACGTAYYGSAFESLGNIPDYGCNCTACPSWIGVTYASNGSAVNGRTSAPSGDLTFVQYRETIITDCYVPAGSYKDDTGTFTLSQACNYTN